MTDTPKSQYTDFSCPNPECSEFRQFNHENIIYRSMTGKNKDIERLKCRQCKKEFSSRRGTLMEYSKISSEKRKLMLKCHRWGVCDEGIANICEVDTKTVQLFQKKTAQRERSHHDQEVKDLDDLGIQQDEAHSKIGGVGAYWIGAAITMQSLLIVSITFGARSQEMADTLLAQIMARFKTIPMFLTDGWQPYATALVKRFGEFFTPVRKGLRGRFPVPRLKMPTTLIYAQVVKARNASGYITGVTQKVFFGPIAQCIDYIRNNKLGNTIHTIHIERWFGTLRCSVPCFRRRTRCMSKNIDRHKNKVWIFVGLYNWLIPHRTLSEKGRKCTPAMAAGLIDHPMTYEEYIWLPVHPDLEMTNKVKKELELIRSKERTEAATRYRYQEAVASVPEGNIAC